MNKAERLFELVQFLRSRRRAVTARVIAERFGVSERSVYRDLQSLKDAGVPIEGAAGVGYLFDRRYELPPLMFDADELEALALGAGMVTHWTDEAFAARAQTALTKIEAVLPTALQTRLQHGVLFSQPSEARPKASVAFSALRSAIHQRQRLLIDYQDERGQSSQRRVRPLGLVFFGPVWLLIAWCELRQGFRNFRLDRITTCRDEGTTFSDEPGRTLADYLKGAADD